jgi:Uma2 family endonuclease
VEVLKSSANDDWAVKVSLYARFGTPETWLVDVEQGAIEMYRALGPERYQQVRIEAG